MNERIVREKLAEYKSNKINKNFDRLLMAMKYDPRYMLMYPLAYLEEKVMGGEAVNTINNQLRRSSISWFLTKVTNKSQMTIGDKSFNKNQYEK